MRLFNKMWKYRVYRKLVLSYIIIVSVTIILISISLFFMFSSNATKEINKISQNMLEQTSYSADVIHNQILLIGNQLLSDPKITEAMYSRKKNYVLEYHAILNLSYIQSIYPFINYISVYNGYTDKYLNTRGYTYETDYEIIDRIQNKKSFMDYEFVPRSIIEPYSKSTFEKNTLSFIFYSDFSPAISKNGSIIINIDETYIKNIIASISNNSNGDIFVIDSLGNVLSHTNSEFFLYNLSNEEYVANILDSDVLKGFSIESIDGQKQLVTYVKSDQIDWTFISVRPYKLLLSNIYTLRNYTLYISIALMVIGIFISILVTRNIYNPLNNLIQKLNTFFQKPKVRPSKINEYDLISDAFSSAQNRLNSLELSLENVLPILEETAFRHLMSGQPLKALNAPEIEKTIKKRFYGECLIAIGASIDNYFLHYTDKELNKFIILNTIKELLSKKYECEAINMEEDLVVFFVQLNSFSCKDELLFHLSKIKEIISIQYGYTITISVGEFVKSIENISQSYQSALEYMKYRLIFGHNTIIDSKKADASGTAPDIYPETTEKKIIEYINLNSPDKLKRSIEHFFNEISKMSLQSAVAYSNQLAISIVKSFEKNSMVIGVYDESLYRILEEISKLDTLDLISLELERFSLKIADALNENSKDKNVKLIEDIQQYVKINYQDPNLFLEAISNYAHLSPGYLGKLFKRITNLTFNDYLNKIRLEKAVTLLLQSELPASEICKKVGIYNYTYFFTLFKKKFGMTPTQFQRNNMILGQNKPKTQ